MLRWLCSALLLTALVLPGQVGAVTPLSGWSHAVEITTDATLIDEAIPVIPVFLSAADTTFWEAVASGGADIRVTEDDGTTILPHYLVSTFTDSGSTGTGCLLVNVSSILSASSDVTFAIHVGNGAASSTSSGADVFSGTDIEAFYLPGVTTDDITGNGYDLTAVNSPTTAASDYEGVTAAVYNGTTQYHYHAASPLATWPFTLEVICAPDNITSTGNVLCLADSSSDKSLGIVQFDGGLGGDPVEAVVRAATGTTTPTSATTATGFSAGAYAHGVATRDGNIGTTSAYIDGGSAGTNGGSLNAATFDRLSLGVLSFNGGTSGFFSGSIAIAAIHAVLRSADWISTNHNAWNDAGFLTFGATSGGGDTGWVAFTVAASNTPGDTAWVLPANGLGGAGTYTSADVPDGDTSQEWEGTAADLSVISDAQQIDGWEIRIFYTGEDGGTEEIFDHTIQMIIDGTQGGDNKAVPSNGWTDSSIQVMERGGASDTWGLSPTAAQMKSSTTGVAIRVDSPGGAIAEARIYEVYIRVYYSDAVSTNNNLGFFRLVGR